MRVLESTEARVVVEVESGARFAIVEDGDAILVGTEGGSGWVNINWYDGLTVRLTVGGGSGRRDNSDYEDREEAETDAREPLIERVWQRLVAGPAGLLELSAFLDASPDEVKAALLELQRLGRTSVTWREPYPQPERRG